MKFLGGVHGRGSLSDSDLYDLAWLYKAADRMRFYCRLIEPALRALNSDFKGAFWSMGHDYDHTLRQARELIERETAHITPKNIIDDWHKVLPVIRGRIE